MKKYYCLIVIGNVEKLEETLNFNIIKGAFMHKNFGKIFISTFESNLSIWEIEEILHKEKRSYFLTKMDGSNFTATVQDINIQNDLFLDYVNKMTSMSNDASDNEPPKIEFIEPIDLDEEIKDIIDTFKGNFSKKPTKRFKKEKVPPTLDELLDKINVVGLEKLTDFEKECLKSYSKS